MAEKFEDLTTDWSSVFAGMKQYLAAIRVPAEYYREGVLKLQEQILEQYSDELYAECENFKNIRAEKGLDHSDSKLVIHALLYIAGKHHILLEFNPDLVLARAK